MSKKMVMGVLLLLAIPLALAAITTETTIFFNVGEVVGFTLTLP